MDPLIASFIIVLLLSGLFAMLGLGGASVYVPVFFWLGVPLEFAIPAGLFINVVATGISSFNYRKMLDAGAAFWILAGALIGAPVGAWLSSALPAKVIIGAFSLVLLYGSWRMHSGKPGAKPDGALKEGEAGFLEEVGASALGVSLVRGAAGGVTGLVSGTLGIGGGIFLVPFLVETAGFTPKKAAVLSTFVVFFASAFGLLGHMASKSLDPAFLSLTGASALVGAFLGSRMLAQGKVNDDAVKKAFAVILLLFGLKLGYDFFTFP